MNVLYTIFIFPIEWVLYHLMVFFHNIVGSYGVTVIMMSVTVSLILSPMAKKALKITEKNKQLKISIQPYVDKIKALKVSYSKKMEMMDSLHKQCGYSPLYDLLGLIPLFFQIPFLIGMYKMVVHNQTLFIGESFLFMKDLSVPDGLLFGINLLPLIMTAINVGAAFAMPNRSRSEFAQALILAALFLVLLYPSPSVLLLYWTCNNLFTLMRMLFFNVTDIHHKRVPKEG